MHARIMSICSGEEIVITWPTLMSEDTSHMKLRKSRFKSSTWMACTELMKAVNG